ncbi:hypothetical protein [Ideonella sp. YS5]|uniref:hypothetical protein n=1 Tax=Ideonella sp. YS5 TaxID=3453714 RepID=UPI003EEB2C33
MRAAPPVDYPVSRHGLWDLAASILAGVAMAVPMAWLHWRLEAARMIGVSGHWTLLASALALAALACVVVWRRQGRAGNRSLRWDGTTWYEVDFSGRAIELDSPSVPIDLGGSALLRVRPRGSRGFSWLPLERRSAPLRWHALRVVLKRASAPAAPAAALAADEGPR